jgi:hypothetical protein
MMRTITLSLGLLFLFPLGIWSTDKPLSYRSNAYDVNTGKFLYSENHTEYYKNGEHIYSIIVYKDSSEKAFAEKRIDFGKKRTQPDFLLKDSRTGYLDRAKLLNASTQEFQMEHTRSSTQPVQTKSLKVPGLVVVDGGFDYFIRDNFQTVSSGQVIRGNFLLTNRLDYFQCRVQKIKDIQFKNRDAYLFALQPENFVLRMIADKILVTYDQKTGRLLEYVGISNLQDDKGEDFPKVRIVFSYPKGVLDSVALNENRK